MQAGSLRRAQCGQWCARARLLRLPGGFTRGVRGGPPHLDGGACVEHDEAVLQAAAGAIREVYAGAAPKVHPAAGDSVREIGRRRRRLRGDVLRPGNREAERALGGAVLHDQPHVGVGDLKVEAADEGDVPHVYRAAVPQPGPRRRRQGQDRDGAAALACMHAATCRLCLCRGVREAGPVPAVLGASGRLLPRHLAGEAVASATSRLFFFYHPAGACAARPRHIHAKLRRHVMMACMLSLHDLEFVHTRLPPRQV